jgi:Uri superfamily endonuclease
MLQVQYAPLTSDRLPDQPGSYALLLELSQVVTLANSRLAGRSIPPGWYAYLGSALGPGGLRGRLGHHLRLVRRPHWHIDWLKPWENCRLVLYQVGEKRMECAWSQVLLGLPGAAAPLRGFGASDCRFVPRCPAHLVSLPANLDLQEISSLLSQAVFGG